MMLRAPEILFQLATCAFFVLAITTSLYCWEFLGETFTTQQQRTNHQHHQHNSNQQHSENNNDDNNNDITHPSSSSIRIPVIGNVSYYYQYEPNLLPLPDGVTVQHAHGIYISPQEQKLDSDDFVIIVTYQDQLDDSKCLLEWKNDDLTKPARLLGPKGSSLLCGGVPHGLTAIVENNNNNDDKGETYLYHANNDQHLSKTTLNGTIIWTHQYELPEPDDNTTTFQPTWFAGGGPAPNSPYLYLADGYGSSRIYQYYKCNGTYTGQYWGGRGTTPGMFQTCHGISWDWRFQQMIVSDRENHRLQYFSIDDDNDPNQFQYIGQQEFSNESLPCNIRFHPQTQQSIIPFLEGNVSIFQRPPTSDSYGGDAQQCQPLEGTLQISQHMGPTLGFWHPHDAHFLPNGDFVLVTWNPGRIGYFRKVEEEE